MKRNIKVHLDKGNRFVSFTSDDKESYDYEIGEAGELYIACMEAHEILSTSSVTKRIIYSPNAWDHVVVDYV